jgi:starch phosphorylase
VRAKQYCERAKDPAAVAELVRWRNEVNEHWPRIRFGSLDITINGAEHVFDAQVYLDEMSPDAVRVEVFAAGTDGRPQVVEMKRGEPLVGASNAYHYAASVPANRPAGDFTPRIVPYHPMALLPLESARILWYR